MKRILSVILALAMMIAVTSTAFAAEITAQTPLADENGVYQISTAEELYGFAELVNGGETSANAVLTADIVVNQNVFDDSGALNSGDFASWTPIGNYNVQYAGTFDGQGHTISGLYFNDPDARYVGLFGYTEENSKILNVGVVDSYIYGYLYVGGVCGYNSYGTVSACYNSGTVSGNNNCVGGICGYNSGTITDCYNVGTINGSVDYVGGVCGYNYHGTITDCYNTGEVSGSRNYISGVCGYSPGGTITGCYNTGTVNGTGFYVGGLCGENTGTITDCYNTGEITGTGKYVGGVCGYNYDSGTIIGCYNSGTVSGAKDIGGVCGRNLTAEIACCYNSGVVSATEYYLGGVCGYNKGTATTITSCYANSGKVYGTNDGTVTDCAIYSDDEFADGTVIALLNAALSSAGYNNIRFYQIIGTESYPVLIDNSIVTSYTVTIPEAIKIGEAVKVSATGVTLKKAEKLTVAITETSEENNAFKLSTTDGAELAYTVKNGNKNVAIGSAILKLGYQDSSGTATLNFVPEGAKFSGSYSGTVTFTVSVG